MTTDSLSNRSQTPVKEPPRPLPLVDAVPGARYRVIRILFSLVREYLAGAGIEEGDVITCKGNGALVVRVARDGGQELSLGDGCGWFVQVLPLGKVG
jgi:hypothetical protein